MASSCSHAAPCHPGVSCFLTGLHQAQVRTNDQLLIRWREPPWGEGGYQRPAVRCGSLVHLGPTLQRAGESLHHSVRGVGNTQHPEGTRTIFNPSDSFHHTLPTVASFPPAAPWGHELVALGLSSFPYWPCSWAPMRLGWDADGGAEEFCAGLGWPFLTPSGNNLMNRKVLPSHLQLSCQ